MRYLQIKLFFILEQMEKLLDLYINVSWEEQINRKVLLNQQRNKQQELIAGNSMRQAQN